MPDEQPNPNMTTDQPSPMAETMFGPVGGSAAPAPRVEAAAIRRRDHLANLLLLAAVGAVLWGVVAAYGAGFNLWSKGAALSQLYMAFVLAGAVVLLSLLLIWASRKMAWRQSLFKRFLALIIAGGFCGYLLSWAVAGAGLPAIHDISTDLADPPQFQALPVRADLGTTTTGGDQAELRALTPSQRWAQIHRQAYPDIRTVRVTMPVAEVRARAETLAKARGWTIAEANPDAGRLEASEKVTPMGYHHDMVLRVRPAETGVGSVIDMRSVSREGQHDLGLNAARIRAFLSELSGKTAVTG